MARRYRCSNCGTDFVSDKPACAACDIDATVDPRAAFVIHLIVTLHYDPPHPKIRRRGLGHRACDPSKPIGTGRGSGNAAVVNCEACKATAAYQAAVAAGALQTGTLDDEDEIVMPLAIKPGDCGCDKKG